MMLPPTADQALKQLVASTRILLVTLRAEGSDQVEQKKRDEVATVATRYLSQVEEAVRTSDARLALGGANALTTVNKAIADFADSSDRELGEASIQVSHDAITAAKLLRAEVGFL